MDKLESRHKTNDINVVLSCSTKEQFDAASKYAHLHYIKFKDLDFYFYLIDLIIKNNMNIKQN